MKKLILVLAIALMASPTFALTVYLQREGTSNIVDVNYSGADAANLPRAFALDVTIDSPGVISDVNNFKTGESTAASKGFGIYPARIDINTAGVVKSWGSPLADTTDPGAGSSAIGTGHVVLEFASLYFSDANKPAISGRLCQLTITPNTTTVNLNVRATAETTYRGGVVLSDGTQFPTDINTLYRKPAVTETITTPTVTKTTAAPAVADKVNGGRLETYVATGATSNLGHTLQYQFTWGDGVVGPWGAATQTYTYTYAAAGSYTVTVQARCATDTAVLSAVSANYVVTRETVKSSVAFYAAWADFGRPICWGYQRNCRGDADGAGSGIGAAKIWVNATDLNILAAGFGKNVAALKAASFGGVPAICADNDRAGTGLGAAKIWVNATDLGTLALYYGKNVAGCPVCNAAWQANYWFWTN
jgi:hypothetical protein